MRFHLGNDRIIQRVQGVQTKPNLDGQVEGSMMSHRQTSASPDFPSVFRRRRGTGHGIRLGFGCLETLANNEPLPPGTCQNEE